MTSAALLNWKTDRADRLDRLLAAHRTVRGVNRRWITDELNHSLILRLSSEFQGFARELHDETYIAVVTALAPNDPDRRAALQIPYYTGRRLDRGNAEPETLRKDFGLFGLRLWTALDSRYPSRAATWRSDLSILNNARNGLAHDDGHRIASVLSTGWTMTLRHVCRWRRTLDGLANGMDHVVGDHVHHLVGVRPW